MPPSDQYYDPLNVMEDGSDLLSSCLRDLSQRLEILNITQSTVLGLELFWPSSSQEDTLLVNRPFWPNLIDVTVSYAPVTPCGKWLLERDPEMETLDNNTDPKYYNAREEEYPESVRIPLEDRRSIYFRSKIIASHADKFYISAAWAALRMPKLRHMVLQIDGRPRYLLEYKVRAGTSRLTLSNEDVEPCSFDTDISIRLAKAKRLY